MRTRNKSVLLLVVLLLVGSVIGGMLGDMVADKVPVLNNGYPIGFEPIHLDLNVIDLTFGFMVDINVASAVGILLAIFIYRKL